MKFLFLRGQVPKDRNPKEILYDHIHNCVDVWTHLIYTMTNPEDYTELLYWGGTREHKVSSNFVERYVSNFKRYKLTFEPDVIFCRGGFPEYHHILKQYPSAFKIYYGAGRRFLPQAGFHDYDLILQDSTRQLKESKKKFPKSKSILYIKPAIDDLFKPLTISKKYDICFPANGSQSHIKGHDFVYKTSPKNLSIYNIGNKPNIKTPDHIHRERVVKKLMPREMQKCRIGIVCVDSKVDSCPRVIPEMIACGIPIVVLNGVRFWQEKYITPETGRLSSSGDFWDTVRDVLDNLDQFNPREYYERELSLQKASDYIRSYLR